jgi:hypothetical protein
MATILEEVCYISLNLSSKKCSEMFERKEAAMNPRLRLGMIIFLACSSAPTQGQSIYPSPEMPDTTPGQHVTIHGDALPTQNGQVYLRTRTDSTDRGVPLAATWDEKTKGLTFLVPPNTPTGRYLVYVTAASKGELLVPGELRVQPDVPALVHLDAIYPQTGYRDALRGKFNFELAGEHFAAKPEDNVLEIIDQGPVTVGAEACAAARKANGYDQPCLESLENISGMETYKLRAIGFQPGPYQGPIQIRVRVGQGSKNVSNALSMTLSAASQTRILVTAAVAFGALVALFFVLIKKGVGVDTIDGEKFGEWSAIFLDRETNSYSLSKFQVVAWLAVAVYSYVYLFLCRTLIQWDFSFPSVSQNLPALFFVSAGTTVAAAGITKSIGSKGAGPVRPSMADFISTGGVVAGDRLQFFIWTIVGCLGYIFLVIRNDPSKFHELPNIPDTFLYLMGVSSAAYLGGKIVRKPGPVIKNLSVARVTPPGGNLSAEYSAPANVKVNLPVLTIALKGENLDPKATVKVDDQVLRGDMFWTNGQTDPQTGFCTELNVSLNAASIYLDGVHSLALINSDGQGASAKFPIDPMSIDPVPNLTHGAGPVDVTINGKNFVAPTIAEWKDASGAEQLGVAVSIINPTKLTVNLIPGTTLGAGKLTLVSPIGLRTSTSVNII